MFTFGDIHKTRYASVLMTAFLTIFSSCGDEGERQETVAKLRALGVAQNPVNAKPGDSVTLTYYLAGPKGLTVTATPKSDTAAAYSVPVKPTAVSQTVTETNYGTLSLYTFQASQTVPSDATMTALLAKTGYARVRSMVLFTTADGDQEDVVSDTITYPASSPYLTWTAPDIAIDSPTSTASAGTISISGTVNGATNESMRLAWFVSTGKIKNRRAKATTWEDAGAGEQTLFFTARGSKSGAFAVKAMTVRVQ